MSYSGASPISLVEHCVTFRPDRRLLSLLGFVHNWPTSRWSATKKRKPVFIKRKWNHVVFSRVTILSFHLVYIYIYIYMHVYFHWCFHCVSFIQLWFKSIYIFFPLFEVPCSLWFDIVIYFKFTLTILYRCFGTSDFLFSCSLILLL